MSNDPDSRNERRKRWAQAHPELTAKPSMKRCAPGHDYRGEAIYMVTLCVEGRRPVLGTLCTPDDRHDRAWVRLSELGQHVKQVWNDIPQFHPEVRPLTFQVMPDHFHGILQVTRPMERPLGSVILGFKKGCHDAFGGTLWEEGYNDRILRGAGQLERWFKYLTDNPRRLWLKRSNTGLFTAITGITIGTTSVTAMGNRFLLDYPDKVAIKCSRSLTEQQIQELCRRFLAMAARGTILVSPCISPGEKKIMKHAFLAGYPTILLLENGFAPMQKPSGRQFDACAQGRLLLIAPWPHHNDERRITKAQCEYLNDLARHIADGNWHAT